MIRMHGSHEILASPQGPGVSNGLTSQFWTYRRVDRSFTQRVGRV